MEQKLRALLGFARKAGKLAVGTEAVKESIKRNRSQLVLIAADISQKSAKEINFACQKNNIRSEVITLGIDDVTQSIGTRAGILSVEDGGFANAIAENLQ